MIKDTIIFDINETVLNLDSLKPKFGKAFDDEKITGLWFSMLLHTSTVCILTGVKTDFLTLSKITLDTVASRVGVELTEVEKAEMLSTFASLQPHDDIKSALFRLRSAGYKTVAFSNSSLNLVSTQIKQAGLEEYFDEIVSVEDAGSFKPDPAAYGYLAGRLNLPVENLRLVATHDWDTHGALNVGMKAAYVDRLNWRYNPLYMKPDITGKTMDEIVEAIIG